VVFAAANFLVKQNKAGGVPNFITEFSAGDGWFFGSANS